MLRALGLHLFTFLFVPLLAFGYEGNVFDAHPIFLCLAYGLLGYGIRAFAPSKRPIAGPQQKTNLKSPQQAASYKHNTLAPTHVLLQRLALVAILVGAIAIQYIKWINDYGHFKSWHSIIGAVSVTLLLLTGTGGYMAHTFPSSVLKTIPKGMKLSDVWRNHGLGGFVASSLMFAALLMGLQTKWMNERVQPFAQYHLTIPSVGVIAGDQAIWYLGAVTSSLIQLGNTVQIFLFT
jgi:hypothetical protein